MKVKEIIFLAMEKKKKKQLLEKLKMQETQTGEQNEIVLSKREMEKLESLLLCFNLVNQEIASDYLPFLTKENVEVKGDTIAFSDLSKRVINIYEVKDKFGFNLHFRIMSNYIKTNCKAKSVVYSFLPEKMQLEDEIEFFNGLSARIYAYGVASEFLLVSGVSSDAEIWEERFKESLFMLSRKHGEHLLPKRRWL